MNIFSKFCMKPFGSVMFSCPFFILNTIIRVSLQFICEFWIKYKNPLCTFTKLYHTSPLFQAMVFSIKAVSMIAHAKSAPVTTYKITHWYVLEISILMRCAWHFFKTNAKLRGYRKSRYFACNDLSKKHRTWPFLIYCRYHFEDVMLLSKIK
jgi:hypothetical protein